MPDIMKCHLCGKLAVIIREGGRRTICCDQLMKKLIEHGGEPEPAVHVPIIEKTGKGIRVEVGGLEDPMEDDHYIEWIEVSRGNLLQVRTLGPGDSPAAEFPGTDTHVKARVYCEDHGVWSNRPAKPGP
jgi:superoxide reductase